MNAKRILIDAKGAAVRTALMNGGSLRELFIDAKSGGSLVGRVVLGTVKNILPSQFAFIDIGQEKNAFMNVSEGHSLKVGQPVLVQVYKDAAGAKGANVGEVLHFNGRFVILHKSPRNSIGISRKIADVQERARLKKLAWKLLPAGYGAIMRTNCAGRSEAEIGAEMNRLAALCEQVTATAAHARSPATLYRENPLMNDLLSDDVAEIIVNDTAYSQILRQSVTASAPELAGRLIFYDEQRVNTLRLFDQYGVERQIERALHKQLWLPCGGFITIEQTEACVIVDVNTGKFAGKKSYRDTILKTNLEAADCVAEQLALRNLSGMIIVDFIDMDEEEDKRTLIRSFTEAIKADRIKTEIVGMTALGLVQLTRRKTRPSLSSLLETECPCCRGKGRILNNAVEEKGDRNC